MTSLTSWLHEVAEAMEDSDRANRLDAIAHPTGVHDRYADW